LRNSSTSASLPGFASSRTTNAFVTILCSLLSYKVRPVPNIIFKFALL
jgi:hypothetical protein